TWYDGRIGVWATVWDDPDRDTPNFDNPRRIANGIMMNKPIVTSTGKWLLCCAIWAGFSSEFNNLASEQYSNVYCSDDEGKTFKLISHVDYPDRYIDEPMAVQLSDGRIWMLIRAKHGIGQAFSEDGGLTWSAAEDSGLGGPCSRFCLRKLKSGNLLLVNHHDFKGRNNLKAMLSRDDGKTWEGFLMIDERADVSYPDATEDDVGHIYIVYDWKRYHEKELYMAVVTEEDILAGKIVKYTSHLRILVNKATGVNQKR
ncbi:MAG: exo-alpha-sialidase, partial [Clostridia bacterium]|nr:exo-alpha-sialidase [Clostridia bacterium]